MEPAVKKCSKEACPKKTIARGFCNNHYQQWRNSQPENRERLREIRQKTTQKNAEKRRAYRKKYWAENKEKLEAKRKLRNKVPLFRFKQAIVAARRNGHCWELSFDDFVSVISSPCTYCQAAPIPTSGSWLDRADCSLGYTVKNVVSCCGLCNRLKNNFLSKPEAIAVIALVKEMRGGIVWKTQ